jgi:asparagine synthase (glutamine-hydrolysing)
MCGIAGKVRFDRAVDLTTVVRMCDAMRHRGPDSRGFMTAPGVALGMQRLAIIDVAGGDQPIFNEDGSVGVVMNGEIYNFRELRAGLAACGHRFESHADTEVLVHLYEEHGERMVEHLRGMFAFALWDSNQRCLILGRDRVGKKPLFFAPQTNGVTFASEVVALLQDPEVGREPNPTAIASYLTYQYVPDPMSAFASVRKLEPGTVMRIDAQGERQRRYWSLDYSAKLDAVQPDELAEQLRLLIWEATRIRLISEVPLGAFLSGGIDSSAVVAAMADQMSEPVKTFSIGFTDADYDETRYARMVAELYGTDHHEFTVEPEAISIMPRLARHYGEPFADPSAIPSFYLAELTSRHVTVALNGDGGDESFAGYNRYVTNAIATRYARLPRSARRGLSSFFHLLGEGGASNSLRSRLQRRAGIVSMEPDERYAYWMAAFPKAVQSWALTNSFRESLRGWDPDQVIAEPWNRSSGQTLVDRMLDVDVRTYLAGDLLVKIDIATMAFSVEGRSPFLDHRLMEFAASLDSSLKFGAEGGKRILKAALRGVVPDEILDRKKMGFGVPLPRWFREELREVPGEVLLDPTSRTPDYVDRSAIQRMIGEHHGFVADHSLKLWVMVQLENWFREVVDPPILPESEVSEGDRVVEMAGTV